MATTQQRTWAKDPATGDHAEVCTWEPNETERMSALWLKFYRYLDARGKAHELRQVDTLCPCGYPLEWCQCERDDPTEIAHEVRV